MSDEATLTDLKQRLVDGLQVLTKENVLDGGGHLSVRVPGTDTFLINPRFAGVLADPEDICTVSAEGKRIEGAGPIPSESVIHAAVYARRPNVSSVLHCHPRYAILVGALEQGLIPFNRQSRIFTGGVGIYPSSKGIRTWEQANEMADALGERWAAFLRGHGVVVCGPGIEGTCISAIQLERSCEDPATAHELHHAQAARGPGPRPVRGAHAEPLPGLALLPLQERRPLQAGNQGLHPSARRRRALLIRTPARLSF